jgi:hypothetical protein
MTDPSPRDDGAESEERSDPGTPLWVKVFGIVALVVVVLFIVLLLTGRGHGPGRHSQSGATQASQLR